VNSEVYLARCPDDGRVTAETCVGCSEHKTPPEVFPPSCGGGGGGLRVLITLRAMPAVALATGRASQAGQVNMGRDQTKRNTLVLQVGGWA
jgi:hypothetical protein